MAAEFAYEYIPRLHQFIRKTLIYGTFVKIQLT